MVPLIWQLFTTLQTGLTGKQLCAMLMITCYRYHITPAGAVHHRLWEVHEPNRLAIGVLPCGLETRLS